jgi:2-polyprenyl-6-methoxyphenol hydroxylase-like FAD-dependent oxidoreductase
MAGQGAALAMTAAYVLAGELAKAGERHEEAFARYEALLRSYIASKQRGAERFAAAFAPKTRWGLFLRNQVNQHTVSLSGDDRPSRLIRLLAAEFADRVVVKLR